MEQAQVRAPFPWFGGKRRVAPLVWERFGDVPNYVEPFAGSLAVLLARPRAPKVETVNDSDQMLANFWRAVQVDPEAVARWADWPVNEADLHARHRWLVTEGRERLLRDPEAYDAQIAGWWVWGICQWIGSGWCTAGGAEWHARPHLGGEVQGIGIHRKLPSIGDAGRGVHRAPDVHEKRPNLNGLSGVHRERPTWGFSRKMPHVSDGGTGDERPCPPRQLPARNLSGVRGHRSEDRTAWLIDYMAALSDRLRHVRVCCGDWMRVMGPSVTVHNGLTGVFLDPPYGRDERASDLYAVESDVADAVREWAIANGDEPNLRICLCGYDGEHEMPGTWEAVPWKAHGGYGSQGEGRGRANAHREMLWFSPGCIRPERVQPMLFDLTAAGG